jgi:hypothetical protein
MPTYPTVYLTVSEADALAPSLLALLQWSASTTDEKTAALAAATRLIDAGLRYQGRKYDSAQSLQFPRAACDDDAGAAETVWDWDPATSAAVIPTAVKLASLIEADEILQDVKGKSQRWRRLDEQHQGVTFDMTSGAAEAYRKGVPPAGRSGLSRRAYELLAPYRLVSGRLV